MQNLDWIMLQGFASGSVGINKPISCIGSNFAFRKSAYYDVGGYESLPFSITEDLLLYKTISLKTKSKFVYPLNAQAQLMLVNQWIAFKSLYQQRKRWAIGSLGIGGFGLFVMLLNSAAHLASVCLLSIMSTLMFQLLCFSYNF